MVEYCDGWMPLGGPGMEMQLAEGVKELRTLCEGAGRRFESLELAVIGLGPERDTAQRLLESGFTHLIFTLPPAGAESVLPLLDDYATLAKQLGSKNVGMSKLKAEKFHSQEETLEYQRLTQWQIYENRWQQG